MKVVTRQVNDVAIVDLSGQIKLGEGSSVLRDTVKDLVGNVQRAVLARELSGGVEVLITANYCLGLDFAAASEIRAQIL